MNLFRNIARPRNAFRVGVTVVTALLSTAFAPSSEAATDGELWVASSGSAEITLEVPNIMRLGPVQTLTYHTTDGATLTLDGLNVCLVSNFPDKTFLISAQGTGPDSEFVVQDADDNPVEFDVVYSPDGSRGPTRRLEPGVPTRTKRSGKSNLTCVGGKNAQFQLALNETVALSPGEYFGEVHFVVEPQ